MTQIYLDGEDFEECIQAQLRYRVDQQVREFLSRQLTGVIEGHIAQLRINDPMSPRLTDTVETIIGERIDAHLREVLPELLDAHLRVKFRQLFDRV